MRSCVSAPVEIMGVCLDSSQGLRLRTLSRTGARPAALRGRVDRLRCGFPRNGRRVGPAVKFMIDPLPRPDPVRLSQRRLRRVGEQGRARGADWTFCRLVLWLPAPILSVFLEGAARRRSATKSRRYSAESFALASIAALVPGSPERLRPASGCAAMRRAGRKLSVRGGHTFPSSGSRRGSCPGHCCRPLGRGVDGGQRPSDWTQSWSGVTSGPGVVTPGWEGWVLKRWRCVGCSAH